jgi:hypothetical protein
MSPAWPRESDDRDNKPIMVLTQWKPIVRLTTTTSQHYRGHPALLYNYQQSACRQSQGVEQAQRSTGFKGWTILLDFAGVQFVT